MCLHVLACAYECSVLSFLVMMEMVLRVLLVQELSSSMYGVLQMAERVASRLHLFYIIYILYFFRRPKTPRCEALFALTYGRRTRRRRTLFAQRSRAAPPILYNYVCVPRKSARVCPAKRELFGSPGLNRIV